jgi:hypothetical protein
MIVLAHIFMLPVEEMLIPIAGGAGAGTLLWLKWKIKRAR